MGLSITLSFTPHGNARSTHLLCMPPAVPETWHRKITLFGKGAAWIIHVQASDLWPMVPFCRQERLYNMPGQTF